MYCLKHKIHENLISFNVIYILNNMYDTNYHVPLKSAGKIKVRWHELTNKMHYRDSPSVNCKHDGSNKTAHISGFLVHQARDSNGNEFFKYVLQSNYKNYYYTLTK